jgi:methionyl aminopeptidase
MDKGDAKGTPYLRSGMITLKTPEQIEIMDRANKITHAVLDAIALLLIPGQNTKALDRCAEQLTLDLDAVPAFKGYGFGSIKFPASICISINEEVVHGIPSETRIIQNGDMVSLDFGAIYKGFVGDAARTYIVGDAYNAAVHKLNEDTRAALKAGVAQMRAGNRLNDISGAIDAVARANNYGNVKVFCGHGVGAKLHEAPPVLNYIDPATQNIRLQEGMVLAIEPMFTLGGSDVKVLDDDWTVVTKDSSMACHWEVSVAITKDGPRILGRDNV